MVKGYLSLRGVEFIVKNVSTDLEGRAELIALGFDSTPVTIIGDQQLSGFDIPTIDKALADLKPN
ncbi:MAG: glutaredoxin family protein [Dehalococcoidia bacterium]|jgi:glutaredoxin 3|nr:glutaredoxin family protein [Dehalococcoidia bacterium]|tara:strand:- start:132 stop:326 length:195 start_codon:yes stop_codon:yes gene_type:complete